MEHTIWLMVSDKKASKTIQEIGKKYSTPVFKPHLTLINGIKGPEKEVVKKFSLLAKDIGRIQLEPDGLGYSSEFFKCIFIRIKKTPELKKFNSKAGRIFGIKKSFSPHISLMYGKIPRDVKKNIMKEIRKFKKPLRIDSVSLMEDRYKQLKWPVVRKFALK